MKSEKLRILVTGANGLLGQKLVNALKDDPEVKLFASGKGESRLPKAWDGSYHWISIDVSDKGQVENAFAEIQPHTLIHTAAMTQVDDCEKDKEGCWNANVNAVANLVAAAEVYQTHFVHVSTDFIFDGENGPYTEDADPNPVNFYGWSKLAAERLVMKAKTPWAIARTILVYGIAQDMSRSNIILWVKKSLEQGKTIQVVNDQWRTPTLAEDLADGCILIAKKCATGVFNISGKDLLTPYQMAVMTADYFGLDKRLIQESNSRLFTQPAKRPPKTGFIIDKAVRDLGYAPKSFFDGIGILAKQLILAES